jgi:hypothetical protein
LPAATLIVVEQLAAFCQQVVLGKQIVVMSARTTVQDNDQRPPPNPPTPPGPDAAGEQSNPVEFDEQTLQQHRQRVRDFLDIRVLAFAESVRHI